MYNILYNITSVNKQLFALKRESRDAYNWGYKWLPEKYLNFFVCAFGAPFFFCTKVLLNTSYS